MTKIKKYPDSVVYDEESNVFNAHLLPYPTDLSSPPITLPTTDNSKFSKLHEVNTIFTDKLKSLASEYLEVYNHAKLNDMIYKSKHSFEPVVGHIYHLYINNSGEYFLSLIRPDEWDMEYVLSVKLQGDNIWVEI